MTNDGTTDDNVIMLKSVNQKNLGISSTVAASQESSIERVKRT